MTEPVEQRDKPFESRRGMTAIAFGVAIVCAAGVGFVYKMTEFAMTIVRHDVEGFGAVAVSIYLIGLLPVIFFMLWAIATGKFRDIEAPKYRVLELDAEIERGGELGA